MEILIVYLTAVNITAFLLYGTDKRKAVRHQWRVPERVLIGIALIGGSLGAWVGMRIFRHKTKHPKFFIGVPLMTAIQAVVFFLVVKAHL